MTRLFDVNVLIAITDPNHVFHDAIHAWLRRAVDRTWASCPITENGMVRVLSQSGYRGSVRTAAAAVALVRQMKSAGAWKHEFWAEDFSLADEQAVLAERIAGPRQVTDVYLVALALRRGGRLVTFDSGIAWQAVTGGSKELIEFPPV